MAISDACANTKIIKAMIATNRALTLLAKRVQYVVGVDEATMKAIEVSGDDIADCVMDLVDTPENIRAAMSKMEEVHGH